MRAGIPKESVLVITSWQPLGLIWLCHIQLMPGCKELKAVRHRGPNIWTYIPELGERWPSLGYSMRCAGHTEHTETPNRLSPASGSGLLLPPGKGSSLQAVERGLRRQTLRPKATGPSAHPPSASLAARLGGRGSGSRRTVRVGDPTVNKRVQGPGAEPRAEKGPLPHRARGAPTWSRGIPPRLTLS